MVLGGFVNHVVRIDLTNQTYSFEPLREEWIKDFVGGRGLAARYLYEELKPGIDPLSPENKLIFNVGPLATTGAQSCSRWMVTTKSPLTGGYTRSVGGGDFGAEMKFAGYDMIIIEGKSEKPVFIYLSENKVTFLEAKELWGHPVEFAIEVIKDRLRDRNARVTAIGPAGENLVRFASIHSDHNGIERGGAAGRGGVGAVMGSKNLKAIAVRGKGHAPLADPKGFHEAVKKQVAAYQASPMIPSFSWTGSQIAEFTNLAGMFPTRNFQKGVLENWKSIDSESYSDIRLKKTQCYACMVHCGSYSRSAPGKFGSIIRTKGPEYETIFAIAGSVDYADRDYVIEYDRLCDDLGLDSISTGVAIGFAFELYEKGLLSKVDTGGMELTWGNYQAGLELTRMIASRQGIGDWLAEGVKRAAERIGNGAERYAIHAKGQELPGYDPRGAKSHGLNLATANTGANHNYGYSTQEVLGLPFPKPLPEGVDRFSTVSKGDITKTNQDLTAMMETGFICVFPMQMTPGIENIISEMLATSIGIPEFGDVGYLWKVGERIYNLERMFNVREGMKDDDHLPRRFIEVPMTEGPSAGQVYEEDELLRQYYEVRGWDQHGVPKPETLQTLGLEFTLSH